MSFSSILKTVAVDVLKVLGVATQFAPLATTVFAPVLTPEAAKLEGLINSGIQQAETIITGVQQGAAKKESTTQLIADALPDVAELVASFGPGFTWDQTALSTAIDASVAAKNSLAAFIATIKKK